MTEVAREFLMIHQAEVLGMLLIEYNEAEAMRLFKSWKYQEIADAMKSIRAEDVCNDTYGRVRRRPCAEMCHGYHRAQGKGWKVVCLCHI